MELEVLTGLPQCGQAAELLWFFMVDPFTS